MASCFCFSQNLKPRVQLLNEDTVFCFTINQSKEIAKLIEKGSYLDTISTLLETENSRLFLVLAKKDSIITKLEKMVANEVLISGHRQDNIKLLESTVKAQNKNIKRTKFHRNILVLTLGVITGFAITN